MYDQTKTGRPAKTVAETVAQVVARRTQQATRRTNDKHRIVVHVEVESPGTLVAFYRRTGFQPVL